MRVRRETRAGWVGWLVGGWVGVGDKKKRERDRKRQNWLIRVSCKKKV